MGADKMLGPGVVDILKVGLSGLVFLLAYMSYRLLSRANTGSTSLRNAQRFMIFTLVLTLLVVISSIVDVYLKKRDASSAHDLGRCRDAVARIETAGRDPRTTLEELRATVNNQLPACAPLFEKEDNESGGAAR